MKLVFLLVVLAISCVVAQEGQCKSDEDCSSGYFCKVEQCGDAIGNCKERAEMCPEMYEPFCGCDGKTYSNLCFVAAAGQSVAHVGECASDVPATEGGCKSNDECGEGQFCSFNDNCAGEGKCSDMPEICPMYYARTCGCDGRIYGNPCVAASAGVSIRPCGGSQPGDQNPPPLENSASVVYPISLLAVLLTALAF